MTNRELDEIYRGLLKIQQDNITLPCRVGYAIAKNVRVIATELKEFITERDNLIREFGTQTQETGAYTIDITDEKVMKAFVERLDPIAEIETNVELLKINIDWFGNDSLPAALFSLLSPLMD